MLISKETIHFDDRPWSVRGYLHATNPDGGHDLRFRFTVPEDLIFSEMRKDTLEISEMLEWVKNNIVSIEKYCADYADVRKKVGRPLKDGDDIIVLRV